MFRHLYIILFLSIFLAIESQGQSSFKNSLVQANPVPRDSNYTTEQKLKIHRNFLQMAVSQKDPLKQLYGYIYLFSDYMLASDYSEADRNLLEAKQLATASGNPAWMGEVVSREAIISIRMEKKAEAARQFDEAVRLFGQAGDTLRMAECIEQLGASYCQAGDYANAKKQYQLAIPLLAKYGNELQMRVALGNFGNVFLMENHPAEAIPYFENSLAINRKLGDYEKQAQDLGDLANAYARLKNDAKAFECYEESIRIAKAQNLTEVLYVTYSDMADTYEGMGNYRAALDVFKKYHALRDSTIGAETQDKIAALQVTYESREKESALQKSRDALAVAQQSLQYRTVLVVLALLCLILAVFTAFKFRQERTRNTKLNEAQQKILQQDLRLKELERVQLSDKLDTRQKDLTNLALDIARKNAFVEALLNKIDAFQPGSRQAKENELDALKQFIISHHRLDNEKAVLQEKIDEVNREFFEKLTARFGELSRAEQELCGLIRLNLSNKEIAVIKSISPNSAKIARYRLRKRLELSEQDDIAAFLQSF